MCGWGDVKMKWRRVALFEMVCLLLLAANVGLAADDVEYRGWGPRVGLADEPDQVVVGAHFDFGEFSTSVAFRPNVELGLGDDRTILAVTAPAHYRWDRLRDTDVVPYAGAGVSAAIVNRDDRPGKKGDDTDFEFSLRAIGGAEFPLKNERSFFVEISLAIGDPHDIQAIVGWNLRKN